MKKFKKNQVILILLDLLIVPGGILCKWLAGQMLAGGKPCTWTLVGARCATCGGTHCVQSFLRGDLIEAFTWNPMVFLGILYAIASLILLNLAFLFRRDWAKSVLRKMYSLTSLMAAIGAMTLFTYLRNIPLMIRLLSWLRDGMLA